MFAAVKNSCFEQKTRGPHLPHCCLNCMKFGILILRKISKPAATRCHILKLKYTKFDLLRTGPSYEGYFYIARYTLQSNRMR